MHVIFQYNWKRIYFDALPWVKSDILKVIISSYNFDMKIEVSTLREYKKKWSKTYEEIIMQILKYGSWKQELI